MHNRATKAQAIALIKAARAAGFTRTISSNPPSGNGWRYTNVGLSGHYQKGLLFAHQHILVEFIKHGTRSPWRVAINSQSDYSKKPSRGLWAARYGIEYIAKLHARD